jgi:hypothetical protein
VDFKIKPGTGGIGAGGKNLLWFGVQEYFARYRRNPEFILGSTYDKTIHKYTRNAGFKYVFFPERPRSWTKGFFIGGDGHILKVEGS